MSLSDGPEREIRNVSGAIIFVFYVTSALVFTYWITHDLFKRYNALLPSFRLSVRHKVRVWSSMSLLSFITLSYNMLHVLIASFRSWKRSQPTQTQVALSDSDNVLEVLVVAPSELWTWLTTSTQFLDFAVGICSDSARYWWTSQALLFTLACSVFIGQNGKSRNVAGLWRFAIIGQILPISFALNLFIVALTLQSDSDHKPLDLALPSSSFLAAYGFLVVYAGLDYSRTHLLLVVASIRLLILYPFWVPATGVNSLRDRTRLARVVFPASVALFSFLSYRAFGRYDASFIIGALNDHPAVSALGYDYILGLLSIGMWGLTRRGASEII